MVTALTSENVLEMIGLSTDTKPTNDIIANGSLFLEMDTGKVFILDKEHNVWIEFGEGGYVPPTPPRTWYKHTISYNGWVGQNNDHTVTGRLVFYSDDATALTTNYEIYTTLKNLTIPNVYSILDTYDDEPLQDEEITEWELVTPLCLSDVLYYGETFYEIKLASFGYTVRLGNTDDITDTVEEVENLVIPSFNEN